MFNSRRLTALSSQPYALCQPQCVAAEIFKLWFAGHMQSASLLIWPTNIIAWFCQFGQAIHFKTKIAYMVVNIGSLWVEMSNSFYFKGQPCCVFVTGPSAVFWYSAFQPGPFRKLHRWRDLAISGARTSKVVR